MSGTVLVVGSFIQDLTSYVDRFPEEGETLLAREFTSSPGGKGSNQAVASHRAGSVVIFVTRVGRDFFGEEGINFLKSEGILTYETRPPLKERDLPGATTGTASILVDCFGRNSISVFLGANEFIQEDYVVSQIPPTCKPEVVITQMEHGKTFNDILCVFNLTQSSGAVKILNPAPMSDLFSREMLNSVDIITPNEVEFAEIIKLLSNNSIELDPLHLLENYKKDISLRKSVQNLLFEKTSLVSAIVTCGESGALIISEEEDVLLPAAKVPQVLSTAGAGDSFNGALASFLSRSVPYGSSTSKLVENLIPAVRWAVAASGISVQRRGTSPIMPYENEIEWALQNYNFQPIYIN